MALHPSLLTITHSSKCSVLQKLLRLQAPQRRSIPCGPFPRQAGYWLMTPGLCSLPERDLVFQTQTSFVDEFCILNVFIFVIYFYVF